MSRHQHLGDEQDFESESIMDIEKTLAASQQAMNGHQGPFSMQVNAVANPEQAIQGDE